MTTLVMDLPFFGDLGLLALALALVVLSADKLVEAATHIAHFFGLSPLVIGLTLVAFGTSLPEMVVAMSAALQGHPEVGVGNAIGSNIANIALVLGACALLRPLAVPRAVVSHEAHKLIAATLLVLVLVLDHHLSWLDGAIMMMLLAVLTTRWIWAKPAEIDRTPAVAAVAAAEAVEAGVGAAEAVVTSTATLDAANERDAGVTAAREALGASAPQLERPDPSEKRVPRPLWRSIAYALVSLVVLYGGSEVFVGQAAKLAGALGLSDLIIGLTIVAIGTSLPELAASIACTWKRQGDMAVGNIVGSNTFNLLGVFAIPGLIGGVDVTPLSLQRDFALMSALTLMLLAIVWLPGRASRLGRPAGIAFLSLYALYLFELASG